MRLRDPVPPDRDGSFARAGAGPGRALVIAGGVLLLLLVVVLVLLLG